MRLGRLLALVPLAALLGCGDETLSSPAPTPTPGIPADGLPASCNPLRADGACLLPFPSAIFLEDDASTATGLRVHLGPEMFPRNAEQTPYDPARMNLADGFSPACEILTYFPERIDPATLPPITDTAKSLSPGSATVIVDMETGNLIDHFSEVDQQIFRDEDRQALILRPSARLAGGRRYAVAVTRSIRTLAGGVPAAPAGWEAILAGTATDPVAKRQAARMADVVDALASVGVAQSDLVVAWDFVTASDEGLTRTMRSMQEQTLSALSGGPLGYVITSVEDDFNARTLRRVRGTFTVPQFLTQTDTAVPEATLTLEESGEPVQSGTYEAPFTLILPRAAETGPVKLLLFGHGFLGSGEGELGGPEGSHVQDFADEKGYAVIATDWTGLSRYEGLDASGSQAAALAVADLNHVTWITDRLHQSIVNNITLAAAARGAIAADPALFVGGAPVIDASRIDYYGISLGGVMGSLLLGYSPDLERGALNVGAAGWSTLFQRSINWSLFKLVLDGSYPEKLDQQVILEIFQAHFDPVDGMSIAPDGFTAPLGGGPPKRVLLQIAVNDVQVPNLASEIYARSIGLPLLSDSPLDVAGLEKKPGPLPSALTAFDLHAEPPPLGNVAAPALTENQVHNLIRGLPAVQAQTDHFLRTGEVISTCDGVCDPE